MSDGNGTSREQALKAWAHATATGPDDVTIVTPPGYTVEEALRALDLEVYRLAALDLNAGKECEGVLVGQGRQKGDHVDALVGFLVASIAALAFVALLLFRVIPTHH